MKQASLLLRLRFSYSAALAQTLLHAVRHPSRTSAEPAARSLAAWAEAQGVRAAWIARAEGATHLPNAGTRT